MATMNISLPDAMKDWVESRAATGRFSNSSDYVRDLIRRDQEHAQALEQFQKLVAEGDASGVSDRTAEEIFEDARRQAIERRARRAG